MHQYICLRSVLCVKKKFYFQESGRAVAWHQNICFRALAYSRVSGNAHIRILDENFLQEMALSNFDLFQNLTHFSDSPSSYVQANQRAHVTDIFCSITRQSVPRFSKILVSCNHNQTNMVAYKNYKYQVHG